MYNIYIKLFIMYHLSSIYPSLIYLSSVTSLSFSGFNDLLYSLFYRQRISYDRMFTMCCLFQQIIQYTCIRFNHHLKFVLGVAELDRCASSHDSAWLSPGSRQKSITIPWKYGTGQPVHPHWSESTMARRHRSSSSAQATICTCSSPPTAAGLMLASSSTTRVSGP